MAVLGVGMVHAAATDSTAASALRGKFAALQDQLTNNQFARPLYVVSSDTSSSVTGDIYARIDTPFATAGAGLNRPAYWCDILMLHLNTKFCRASADERGSNLQVYIGRKFDQPMADAYRVDFAYLVAAQSTDYLKVMLTAEAGPLSTRDYRVILEAVPSDNGATFIHLTYAYSYGIAGQLAMQAYLATVGRGKVGFTVMGKQSDGQPQYIGGMRGVVERNTMRYYLAIDAYLGAMSVSPPARLEKSLRDWFAGIERYPRQLHELQQNEYLDMKRKEYLRIRSSGSA